MCTTERRMRTCDEIKMNTGNVAIITWAKHVQQKDRHVKIVGWSDIIKKSTEKKVQYINKA